MKSKGKAATAKIARLRKKIADLREQIHTESMVIEAEKVAKRNAVQRQRDRAPHKWRSNAAYLRSDLPHLPHRCSYYSLIEYFDERENVHEHNIHRCQMGGSQKIDGLHFCIRHARMVMPDVYGKNKGPYSKSPGN